MTKSRKCSPRQAENHPLVGFEHESPRVNPAMVTSRIGRELHNRGAARIGQAERHAAGSEVQRNEKSLIQLPLEAEDLSGRVNYALRPGLQRAFVRTQPEKAAHKRKRRRRILIVPVIGVGIGSDYVGTFRAVLSCSVALAVLCVVSAAVVSGQVRAARPRRPAVRHHAFRH
jgi:hypothetical protein